MPRLVVSPHRTLILEDDARAVPACYEAFLRGTGHGILYLDTADSNFMEEASFCYFKDFSRLYLSLFAAAADHATPLPFPAEHLAGLLSSVPEMKGAEYVDAEFLLWLWQKTGRALDLEITESRQDVASFFAARHGEWNLLGRVCFHLAENKNSESSPFAFLATYVHRLSSDGTSKHLPLKQALAEYAGQKDTLLTLLSPIHKATEESAFLNELVGSGRIYHPLAWKPAEAYQFLKDIPLFEKAGIAVKIPNWWKKKQRSPEIKVSIGEDKPKGIGFGALLDFRASLVLGDEALTEEELANLLMRSENLVFFKGQWVEIDQQKLSDLLTNWKKINRQMQDGVSLSEGMRFLSGMEYPVSGSTGSGADAPSIRVVEGTFLKEMLSNLRTPKADVTGLLAGHLRAVLRPYQEQGVAWLALLNQLRLGAILADDMGLGKTLQVISLLTIKKQQPQKFMSAPSLLVVPASLLGNWKAELMRFSPELSFHILHMSEGGMEEPEVLDMNLIITTYGGVLRKPWLAKHQWDMVILDEAQAIKNPDTKQTKAVKALSAQHKLALTGTPVENRLSDLWSLFDFVSPGLLGSAKEFASFLKAKRKADDSPYTHIRQLVSPYILRRMKTDKRIISDLPDKTEIKSWCQLSKAQAALYQQAVDGLMNDIRDKEAMERRGIIFSYLMRFKQICNHPSQWVKDGEFAPEASGKFLRLQEICETVASKQEKMLVFTQFQEMTEPLARFLKSIFGKEGLVLHGGTEVRKRSSMVEAFQKDDGPPFFVLSLKAGGTGLNLTAASHVVHFDRWWNPAIENQATDRAFRIGQKKNVLVHKFICKGTLEDEIDCMIEEKMALSKEVMECDGGMVLTEMSDQDLLKVVALDLKAAMGDG